MSNFRKGKKQSGEIVDKGLLMIGGIWFFCYAAACYYLYFMQATHMEGQYFESDLPYHINMALDGWGYSITAWVYRILSFLPGMYGTISLFLVLATLAALILTFFYFRRETGHIAISLLGTFACTFAMPAFIRAIHYQRYIGYQSGSIWHNSTYIVMKPIALASMLLYLKIANKYGKKKCLKEAVIFAILLALTTGVKTSFVFVFAPAAFLFLVLDFLLGTSWKKIWPMALTVVPSLLVILMQEVVLFGEDTGNSIILDFGYNVYLRAEKPYFTMILSALFPVLIFLVNIVAVLKDTCADFKRKDGVLTHRAFLLSWTMWLFGALELLLLRETGKRELDGNFSWGYDFCLFILFIISICYFVKNLKDRTFLHGKIWAKILYAAVMGGILFYHTYCGMYFFLRLMEGTTYFM